MNQLEKNQSRHSEFIKAWNSISRSVEKILDYKIQCIDDCYNQVLYKALTLSDDIKDPRSYLVSCFLSAARNIRRYEINKHYVYIDEVEAKLENKNDKWLDYIGFHDNHFTDLENKIEEEVLYERLDAEIKKLTSEQQRCLFLTNNKAGEGTKKEGVRTTKRLALNNLRYALNVKNKNPLTEKEKMYLDIYKKNKSGEIKHIREYLKSQGLSFSTYYIMVKIARTKE